MRAQILVAMITLLAACTRPSAGRVVVVVTVDWEGAELSAEGLDALDELRKKLGSVPVTHFVSAAYFTKAQPDPDAAKTIGHEVRDGDELAVHLHAWRSLVVASGVAPKLSPSFLTGTDQVVSFDDGDAGFDTDLDAYNVAELRAMLRTSRQLLGTTGRPVSSAFRAGGYLGTPKMIQAIEDEGFTVDSSAVDPKQIDEHVLSPRLREVWPGLAASARPWRARPGVLELPIAALADYATTEQIAGALTAAQAQLRAEPRRDVIVVLGFHLETAHDFAGRLVAPITGLRAQDGVVFATVSGAAERIRAAAR